MFMQAAAIVGLLLLFFILLRLGQILLKMREFHETLKSQNSTEAAGGALEIDQQVTAVAPLVRLEYRHHQHRLLIVNESDASFHEISIDIPLEQEQQREIILLSERASRLPYPLLNGGEDFEVLINPDPMRDSGLHLHLSWSSAPGSEKQRREIYLPL